MVSAIVGRLPALKYFDAASSYSFHTSSVGWRQETSACVWTSIAIRSLMFMVPPLKRTARCFPFGQRTPLAHQSREQRRRLPVQRSESVAILEYAVMDGLEADGVGIIKRPAAVAGESVAGAP